MTPEKADILRKVLDEKDVRVFSKSDGYQKRWQSILARVANLWFAFLYLVTCGRHDSSFEDYTTVFGKDVYLASHLDKDNLQHFSVYKILRHELIHVLQHEKDGSLKFILKYFFLPLPFVYTFRSDYEMPAYAQNLLCYYEHRGHIPPHIKQRIVNAFMSPDYVWMRPFRERVEREVERICVSIEDGDIEGLWPYEPDALSP